MTCRSFALKVCKNHLLLVSDAGASIWFVTGCVAGPGFKTGDVMGPKNSTEWGTSHRFDSIILGISYL